MRHILIVEDDSFIREELETLLQRAGYLVSKIMDFKETSRQILECGANLVLLDMNLPGESGFEICKNVKSKSSIPILVLTSREQLKDEICALKLGADEYITKPVRKERLLVRIENVLKRYEGRNHLLERDDFLLDKNTYTLYIHGTSVLLPPNQGKLLEAFLTSGEGEVTKEELCMKLWDTTEYIDENALQVNVTRLKQVMKKVGMEYRIQAIRGRGYKMVKEEEDEV